MSCGNTVGTNRRVCPDKQAGNKYDSLSYRKVVGYAVKKANTAIKKKAQGTTQEPKLIPSWTPYQFRHTAATKVRREMGYESASAALGHTKMIATEIYAERNQGLADEAAKKFG